MTVCTALLLGKLMFQRGDSFLRVVLAHQQMVPPAGRAGQEIVYPRLYDGSAHCG
jgi:hypothetical protein